MLTTLQTSYTDTRAGDLAWCLGGGPCPRWRCAICHCWGRTA